MKIDAVQDQSSSLPETCYLRKAVSEQYMTEAAETNSTIQSWCRRELIPWEAKRLNFSSTLNEMKRRNDTRPMEFLFHIRDGKASMAYKAPETPDRVPVWRAPLYLRFINEVVSRFCPDLETDLLININDGQINRETIPIFSFQKPSGSNSILIPDVDFLEYNFYYANPRYTDPYDYREKTCSAVFAGATTGGVVTAETLSKGGHPRLRSALFFKGNSVVDFRLPILTKMPTEVKQQLLEMGFGDEERLSYHQQFKHKFIISMDGWGATCSRLPITLRSNSVLLKYTSPHQLYYFGSLTPWLHYVPIEADEEVINIIQIEERKPGSFALINQHARNFADRYLTRLQAMKYTAWLLLGYVDSFASSATSLPTRRNMTERLPFASAVSNEDIDAASPSLVIVAHISDSGNLWFRTGDWVGEDRPGALIEGFILEPGVGIRPSDLEYRFVDASGLLSEPCSGGMLSGTMRKRQALYGLAVRTTGDLARRWECVYTARFDDASEIGPVRQGTPCRAASGARLRAFRLEIVHSTEVGAPPSPSPITSTTDDRSGLESLFMKFESLGGSGHGCEFGLVQRHYGAEPLGLLRWADLGFEQLVSVLESRFSGVGEAEHTVLFSPEHAQDEYWTRDKRFHMAMRTFVKVVDVPYERMLERVYARLKFLRRKLIEDLEGCQKIFVYRNMYKNPTNSDIIRLHTAVESYGKSSLLCLLYSDHIHPHGSVESIRSGLFVGYVERFAFSPENKYLGPSQHIFLDVCRNALRTILDP